MLNISPIVKQEKNKLNTDSVFLVALKITIPGVPEPIHIVNNNEDIIWPTSSGIVWQMFPFDIDEMSETSKGETAQFSIKVGNTNNVIGDYVRQYDVWVKQNGFTPIEIILYVINTFDLANSTPAFEYELALNSTSITSNEVTFTVSARDLYRARMPMYRMFPNSCRFKFKSALCGYTGSELSCDKTLGKCRSLNNSHRYGGFPSIGNQGVST